MAKIRILALNQEEDKPEGINPSVCMIERLNPSDDVKGLGRKRHGDHTFYALFNDFFEDSWIIAIEETLKLDKTGYKFLIVRRSQ